MASLVKKESEKVDYRAIFINKKTVYLDIDDCYLRVIQKNKKVVKNSFRMITAHPEFEGNSKKVIGKELYYRSELKVI